MMWYILHCLLKNISQWEGLSHILWTIKNVWNHQPFVIGCVTHWRPPTNRFSYYSILVSTLQIILFTCQIYQCVYQHVIVDRFISTIFGNDLTWHDMCHDQNMVNPSYNGNTRSSYHDISSYLILNCESHILYYKWYDFTCFTLS